MSNIEEKINNNFTKEDLEKVVKIAKENFKWELIENNSSLIVKEFGRPIIKIDLKKPNLITLYNSAFLENTKKFAKNYGKIKNFKTELKLDYSKYNLA